jgi:hypothetical protein
MHCLGDGLLRHAQILQRAVALGLLEWTQIGAGQVLQERQSYERAIVDVSPDDGGDLSPAQPLRRAPTTFAGHNTTAITQARGYHTT